jgi:perosamine synthetase
MEALGVGVGDEVVVPTWTFTASAEVAAYLGARIRLVDVDRDSLNASIDTILEAVTDRTRAVIAVHFAGLPMEIGRLVSELTARGVAVVEDAAHAFPSPIPALDGRYAGTIGAAGAYSFYATKTITTGEGGMLVTNDDGIARRARMMSLHGISRDAWNRYAAGGTWYYEVAEAGYKYNMTDVAAAMGIVQLGRSDELLAERQRLSRRYRSGLAASNVADLVDLPPDGPGHAWHLFVIRLNLDRLTIDRAALIDALREDGIGTSVHFIPLHLHPYYRRHTDARSTDFPVANSEYARVVSLPIWPGMGDRSIDRVINALESALGGARR